MNARFGFFLVVSMLVCVLSHEVQACDSDRLSSLYSRFYELYGNGQFHQAALIADQGLQAAESSCAQDDLSTADNLDKVADLYRSLGRNKEAEPLYQRALKIREQKLGPDDPLVATSLCNLGELYWAEGRLEEAKPLYQRALEIRESQLGADHPDTIQSQKDLDEFDRTHGY